MLSNLSNRLTHSRSRSHKDARKETLSRYPRPCPCRSTHVDAVPSFASTPPHPQAGPVPHDQRQVEPFLTAYAGSDPGHACGLLDASSLSLAVLNLTVSSSFPFSNQSASSAFSDLVIFPLSSLFMSSCALLNVLLASAAMRFDFARTFSFDTAWSPGILNLVHS